MCNDVLHAVVHVPESLIVTRIPTPQLTAATEPQARIESIDVLRGVAVLGILAVNIWEFALPWEVANNPTLWGEYYGADKVAWWVSWIGVEGSQRAIFTMLFGAGVLLFTDRLSSDDRASSLKRIYYRRTVLLIGFGLINSYLLLWLGDILFFYGVVGLFLFFARNWQPRVLVTMANGLIIWLSMSSSVSTYPITLLSVSAEDAEATLETMQPIDSGDKHFEQTCGGSSAIFG